MFERILRFAIEQRWLVLLAVLGMAGVGVYSYQRLPIDAVPDITNVQVQINAAVPGASPLETEQRVTFPIETAMAGLPHLRQTRSLSRSGFAQITVIFDDGTDLYFARQLVSERLQAASNELPQGVEVTLGPISTGLGEIFLWTVEAEPEARRPDGQPYTPTDLREIQDWIIKPQLRNVRGVAEINTIGGFAKEYQVAPDPKRMAAYRITLEQLVVALERNNANVGAGFIERNGEQLSIRTPGQLGSPADIGNIVLSNAGGAPVRVRDIAEVGIGRELRSGAATDNGREVVLGTAFMLVGENSRSVSQAVAQRLEIINQNLPKGVSAITVYDRTDLVDKAIATVRKNLIEGAILVIAVLFLISGVTYNVKPLRTKDVVFGDVLTESINNPLRLMLGWAMVDPSSLPPVSVLLSYWFGGAFLMNAKRLAEFRDIVAEQGQELLGLYRRSFRYYTERRLLVASLLYALFSIFFLAVFLIKYKVEYVLVFPALSFLFAEYFILALKQNSVARKPEHLFKARRMMVLVAIVVALFVLASVVNIPLLETMTNQHFIELPVRKGIS